MEKFTEKTNLSKILKNPKLVEVLEKYNLPCLVCPFLRSEIENLTIGDVCKTYNIDIKKLLQELNKIDNKIEP
jgi:hypothetical protein